MKALLIFEPEATGHRPNYFNAFIRYAADNPDIGNVIFAISKSLYLRLEPQARIELERSQGRLRVHFLTPAQVRGARRTRFEVASNFNRWRLALRLAEEAGANRIHFPLVDDVLKAAAVLPATKFTISGIYFRPTTHFREYWKGPWGWLRQASKTFLVRRFLQRPDTLSLLTFDPFFVDFAQAAYPNASKVHPLPEPIDLPRKNPSCGQRGDRLAHFLFFGALQSRKGVRELVAALGSLKAAYYPKTRFSICGEGEMAPFVERSLEMLRRKGCHVAFEKGFLSEPVLRERFASADAILAPYRDHIGSSGALYVAAGHCIPVITQNTGLLGRQVAQYRLGEGIDTFKPAEIARAIERLTDKILAGTAGKDLDFASFTAGHGAEAFARAVYDFS